MRSYAVGDFRTSEETGGFKGEGKFSGELGALHVMRAAPSGLIISYLAAARALGTRDSAWRGVRGYKCPDICTARDEDEEEGAFHFELGEVRPTRTRV